MEKTQQDLGPRTQVELITSLYMYTVRFEFSSLW